MPQTLLFANVRAWVRRGLLAVAMLPVAMAAAQSIPYTPAGSANVAGTYTDLGAAGAAIATANTDDANSAAQDIGFTFTFNGTAFTQFVLNTNGFVRLGATAPSAVDLYLGEASNNVDPILSNNAADVNILAPFNFDLAAGTAAGGTEYRVATTGTQPNRVCTVQWKNVQDKAATAATQYASFSFQLKVYEGTNAIEFVYGPVVAGTGAAGPRFPVVGIKGSGLSDGQTVLAEKTQSGLPWSAATFRTGYYPIDATGTTILNTHNFRSNVPPDLGRTYRFVATPLALAVYTLGKAAGYTSPLAVQAGVVNYSNTTLTNLPVTLTVSGATTFTNTQTVASLAPGAAALVTFATYPITATSGTNTIAVAVPATTGTPALSQTITQTLSASDLSYLTADPTLGVGVNNAANSVLAVGYRINSAVLTTVTPTFVGAGAAGSTYQVVVYGATSTGQPGAALYTSPVRARPAATSPDAVAIPSIPVSGKFFVGVRTIGTDNIGLGYQDESPLLRPATFYLTLDGTAWTDISSLNSVSSRLAVDVTLGPGTPTATRAALGNGGLVAFPNPASRDFTLSLPAVAGARTAAVALFNSLGQRVQARTLDLAPAGTQARFDVSSLAPGLYVVRVQAGSQAASLSVTLQ
ncbi:T9SS type A sorting domain-containing protein [Hymenobacter caeli]|uniref:Secretion system C-terminal sorting domain-containing protein n=1 Tax=Hymenobacter caeli TaxID=2735894 RepID=A0ABX2FMS4_9BACT|nr:T9SS type A sorting domain-containing protein [Hymenobacter caeli]NRT18458.1 hypothetical protein [Hymenobacter caeli]